MSCAVTGTPNVDSKNAEKLVCQAIKKAEADLRSKYKLLNYQDFLGASIFFGSIAGILGCWAFYYKSSLPSHFKIPISMFGACMFTSFLHELEHDIIHNLYFKKSMMQDVMFFFIWIFKLHGNPWYRREMHLKHHIVSGQTDDAEERLIGLGLPFGWKRMAAGMHPFGSLILTKEVKKDSAWLDVQRMNLSSAPVAFLFMGLNKLFMLYVGAMLIFGDKYSLYLPERHWWWIRDSNILVCVPNVIRQACLVAMSNLSHYYGDIPEKSVFYQNQILDHWILYPFQHLCCNFGATHIVHHYVPGQPFYIRELVYRKVKDHMISLGVRHNDFGIITRANRYYDNSVDNHLKAEKPAPAAPLTVSSNGSHMGATALWLTLCSTVGAACYVIFDHWTAVSLGQRIFSKYLSRTKIE